MSDFIAPTLINWLIENLESAQDIEYATLINWLIENLESAQEGKQ
jgi:hypothetical protein